MKIRELSCSNFKKKIFKGLSWSSQIVTERKALKTKEWYFISVYYMSKIFQFFLVWIGWNPQKDLLDNMSSTYDNDNCFFIFPLILHVWNDIRRESEHESRSNNRQLQYCCCGGEKDYFFARFKLFFFFAIKRFVSRENNFNNVMNKR